MYVDTTNQTMAKIATNKSLLKEFDTNNGRTVYLKNGDEYQIQLYNPTDEEIAASVFIDGKELSNQLVLRPAERIWLERYLDTPRKFKFNTYEVEDNVETEKAISYNGCIEVKFYKKSQPIKIVNYSSPLWKSNDCFYTTCLNDTSNYIPKGITVENTDMNYFCACEDSLSSTKLNSAVNCAATLTTSADTTLSFSEPSTTLCSATIETGRTGKGSHSDQVFEDVDMDFASYPFKTEKIKILPQSQKPYTANDLEKIYCTECGRKLKTKYKFCPYCGTKIDY